MATPAGLLAPLLCRLTVVDSETCDATVGTSLTGETRLFMAGILYLGNKTALGIRG